MRGWCAGDAGQRLSLFIHYLRWSQICYVYVGVLAVARRRKLLATKPRQSHGHVGWSRDCHGREVNRLRARALGVPSTAPGSDLKGLWTFRPC